MIADKLVRSELLRSDGGTTPDLLPPAVADGRSAGPAAGARGPGFVPAWPPLLTAPPGLPVVAGAAAAAAALAALAADSAAAAAAGPAMTGDAPGWGAANGRCRLAAALRASCRDLPAPAPTMQTLFLFQLSTASESGGLYR